MALRGRVGRHAQTGGRHCQNWVEDQQAIVSFLNQIPVDRGGAGGQLRPRIIAGLASDDLYKAILRFEDMHFPSQRSGFVDPSGPMYQRLQSLASTAPPLSPSAAPSAVPPENSQPPRIDDMLAQAEKWLAGNPNYPYIKTFLNRLKADGYTQVIQNDRIIAYLFGTCRVLESPSGNHSYQREKLHVATPVFAGNWIKPEKRGVVLMYREKFFVIPANYEEVSIGTSIVAPPPHAPRTPAERDALRRALTKLDAR